jgi:thiol:disulfide interchange protein DsbC
MSIYFLNKLHKHINKLKISKKNVNNREFGIIMSNKKGLNVFMSTFVPAVILITAGILITTSPSINDIKTENNNNMSITGNISSYNIKEASENIKKSLSKHFEQMVIKDISLDRLSGLYVLRLENAVIMYTNATGDFLITTANQQHPQIFSLKEENLVNLTDVSQKPYNKELIDSIDDEISFKAENERVVITVYSDPACGYCQKLHNEIDQYNALGITINYAARPIFGDIPTEAMYRIWSLPENERKEAFTKTKEFFGKRTGASPVWAELGLPEIPNDEAMTSVEKQSALGLDFGFTGTPGLVLPDGSTIGGYQSPEDLSNILANKGF